MCNSFYFFKTVHTVVFLPAKYLSQNHKSTIYVGNLCLQCLSCCPLQFFRQHFCGKVSQKGHSNVCLNLPDYYSTTQKMFNLRSQFKQLNFWFPLPLRRECFHSWIFIWLCTQSVVCCLFKIGWARSRALNIFQSLYPILKMNIFSNYSFLGKLAFRR